MIEQEVEKKGNPVIKRLDGSIIIPAGKYVSLKKAIEESSADLSSADLRSANLRSADLSSADLRSADLRSADLRSADLRSANLRNANLRYADLSYADLRYADLRSANLSYADLRSANLRSANLDFSCWPLWCGSQNVKVDKKIALQILAHFIVLDCEEQEIIELQSLMLSTGLPQLSHRAKELLEAEDAK